MAALEQVIPLLVYRDIDAAHEFLGQAFGFESGGVRHTADGQAVHGEVRVGGTTIWLHRATTEPAVASPQTVDMAGSGLVVYVPDVDAHFVRARPGPGSTRNRPTNLTDSVSTGCAIRRAIAGGSPRQAPFRSAPES